MFSKMSLLSLSGSVLAGLWVLYFSFRRHSQPDGMEEAFLSMLFLGMVAVLWSLAALLGLIGFIKREASARWSLLGCLVFIAGVGFVLFTTIRSESQAGSYSFEFINHGTEQIWVGDARFANGRGFNAGYVAAGSRAGAHGLNGPFEGDVTLRWNPGPNATETNQTLAVRRIEGGTVFTFTFSNHTVTVAMEREPADD
ncbi:MAG TPA: hypothetical protein DCY13_14350 [Verrucomicrobiales bacterium]|nr:hypothetical protein [Verrucomicrobiales bacterium]